MTWISILNLQFDDLWNHCDVGRNKANSMAFRIFNNGSPTVKSQMYSMCVLTRLSVTHLYIKFNFILQHTFSFEYHIDVRRRTRYVADADTDSVFVAFDSRHKCYEY